MASSSLNLTSIAFFLSSNYAVGVEFVGGLFFFFSTLTVRLFPLRLPSILETASRGKIHVPCLCCGGTVGICDMCLLV